MRLHELELVKGENIYLRPFNLQDTNDVFEWCSNPAVTKYLSFSGHENKEETHMVINTILLYDSIAIVESKTNKCIGSFGLITSKNSNSAEFGYCLNENYWKKGYMSETFNILFDWIRKNTSIDTLTAEINKDNLPSFNLLSKYGFTIVDEYSKYMELKHDTWQIQLLQLKL